MKGFFRCIRSMSPEGHALLLTALRLSCVLLLTALVLLIHTGTLSWENVAVHRTVRQLYRQPAGLIALGLLGSYLLEERSRRG